MGIITIIQGDITTQRVDVIVNAANTRLCGGGGVDGAIHRAAGPSVMEECARIGHCATGDAVITNAGNLVAKKIIHTVGPVWRGGKNSEPDQLRSCYATSFRLARQHGLATIAFPAISTGVYRYPIEPATEIAIAEGLQAQIDFSEIRYICFSECAMCVYQQVYERLCPAGNNERDP